MSVSLKKVAANKLFEIRRKILRNNTSYKDCQFEGDNKNSSVHIGAFINDVIVGGVSLLKNKSIHKDLKNCYQLRGMCVLKNFQNHGIGIKLLNEAERYCSDLGVNNIWMYARKNSAAFYLKSNYIDLGIRSEIKGIGPVSYTHLTLPTILLV